MRSWTTGDYTADDCEKAGFDFTTLIPSAAGVEPAGILQVASSFDKPICH